MYRYRRREWDESRGVAYVPARVLTDQGRINPGGSVRAVARRARVNVASVSRT